MSPAMLMAADLPLPRRIVGMTDGRRNVQVQSGTINPADRGPVRRGTPLRLFLTKEMVFGSDGDSRAGPGSKRRESNVNLANNLGNLVNRVTAMAERYRQGQLGGRAYQARGSGIVRRR